MGQGGFTCHQFVEAIGEPVTVALRSPIPLETGLDVVHLDDCWHLVDPSDPGTVILEATGGMSTIHQPMPSPSKRQRWPAKRSR